MHDAVLHLHDAPLQELIERSRCAKIKRGELRLEGGYIERWHDRPSDYPRLRARQFAGQEVIQSFALGACRKQRR
jgi:hypothetical protein